MKKDSEFVFRFKYISCYSLTLIYKWLFQVKKKFKYISCYSLTDYYEQ